MLRNIGLFIFAVANIGAVAMMWQIIKKNRDDLKTNMWMFIALMWFSIFIIKIS